MIILSQRERRCSLVFDRDEKRGGFHVVPWKVQEEGGVKVEWFIFSIVGVVGGVEPMIFKLCLIITKFGDNM